MDQSVADVPQIRKKQYKNNTAGWLGVVILDHNGQEQGVNVEPLGYVWLSDAEAILTARAPRDPRDNPFEERTFVVQDPATQMRSEIQMRPLVLVSEEGRDMLATDRYVPGIVDPAQARAEMERAAHSGEGQTTPAAVAREREVVRSTPTPPSTGAPPQTLGQAPATPAYTPVPPVAQTREGGLSGPPGAADADGQAESWVDHPVGPVQPGALRGDEMGPPRVDVDPTLPQPGDRPMPTVQAAPQTVGSVSVAEEELAERVDPRVGEETGAARPPATPQPEGEYARAEEVGSPDAPTWPDDDDSSGLIGG